MYLYPNVYMDVIVTGGLRSVPTKASRVVAKEIHWTSCIGASRGLHAPNETTLVDVSCFIDYKRVSSF